MSDNTQFKECVCPIMIMNGLCLCFDFVHKNLIAKLFRMRGVVLAFSTQSAVLAPLITTLDFQNHIVS